VAKKRNRKTAAAADKPAERLVFLLEALWSGNRSAMAAAIGCSHTAISQVATGKRPLGGRLMKLVAEHPKVNPIWLLSGEGEPLLAEGTGVPSEGWPVPVVHSPLPGPPMEHPALLTGRTFPAPGVWARESRYWLQIRDGQEITTAMGSRLAAGVLLLIETDVGDFRREPQQLNGRLGVINTGTDAEVTLQLMRFVFDANAGLNGLSAIATEAATHEAQQLGVGERKKRLVKLDPKPELDSEADMISKPKRKSTRPTASTVDPNEVVGVMVAFVGIDP